MQLLNLATRRHLWAFILVVGSAGGCGTIPDLKPFADATGDIQSGVSSLGTEYSAMISPDLACPVGTNVKCKQKFDDEWKSRIVAVKAIAGYSDSLAKIADSGRSAAESAGKVVSAAQSFLGTIGATPFSAPITAAVKLGLTELSKFRALKSLDEAVDQAHPIIADVVDVLDKDLGDLQSALHRLSNNTIVAVLIEDDKHSIESTLRFARLSLAKQQNALTADFDALATLAIDAADYRRIVAARSTCSPADATDCARTVDAAIGAASGRRAADEASCRPADSDRCRNRLAAAQKWGSECKVASRCEELFRNATQSIVGLDKSIGEAQQRIAATEAQVQGATRSFAPVKEKVDAIEAREKNLRAAIAKLRSSLQDWIIVHRGLGQNVRDSLKPDIRSLLTTANDIRKIVEDLRSTK